MLALASGHVDRTAAIARCNAQNRSLGPENPMQLVPIISFDPTGEASRPGICREMPD